MIRVFLIVVIFSTAFFRTIESNGQCTDCTITVNGDDAPIGEIINGSTVCISGIRTVPLDLLGRTNLRLCFDNTAIFTGGFVNMVNPITISNYGQIGTAASPINLTLGAGSVFNNNREYTGNFVSNGGANINNSGANSIITGNVTLNATGAIYNNLGLQTGALSIGNGNTVNNSNIFNISTLTLPAGGTLNNLFGSSLIVTNNTTINGNLTNEGFVSFTNTVTIALGRTLVNKGTFNALNFTINGTVSSLEGSLNVGQTLTNNASGIFNIGSGTIGSNLTNSGTINIYSSLSVLGSLTNNTSAQISTGSVSQPAYLSVGGTITNNGCLNGINNALHVNKFPINFPSCTNDEVYFAGNSPCPQIIDILDEVNGGYQYYRKVYIFTCDMNWLVPDAPTNDEELLLDDAEILIIGGGGGGGMGASAGGGGAGEVRIISKTLSPNDPIEIKIGIGGLGSQGINFQGNNGQKTSFGSDDALGGGGGGSNANNTNAANRNGKPGGSGGGGAYHVTVGLPGEKGTGPGDDQHAGAIGKLHTTDKGVIMNLGGGGGGATGPGKEGGPSGNQGIGVSRGGDGGPGFPDPFLNNGNIYAGGGGGTSNTGQGNSFGGKGLGAGGDGNTRGRGYDGITAGSGGGAGSGQNSNHFGGNGAKGLVMVTQFFRILPVYFIHFSSEYVMESRTAKLAWSTSKEWENSHFEIERSLDGTKTFVKIGQVSGMGWTDEVTEYLFEDDKLPLSGGNIYYRLKQVDFNGRFDYSDITAVRIPNIHITKGVWRVYPNPSEGNGFNLELVDVSQYHDESISLRILSSHILSTEKVFRNIHELNQTASDFLSNVPKGLWIVEVKWGNRVERIKVMKR